MLQFFQSVFEPHSPKSCSSYLWSPDIYLSSTPRLVGMKPKNLSVWTPNKHLLVFNRMLYFHWCQNLFQVFVILPSFGILIAISSIYTSKNYDLYVWKIRCPSISSMFLQRFSTQKTWPYSIICCDWS